MSPFECRYNFQLFFLAITIADASELVRFHFVLLLKKFVSTLDSFPDIPAEETEELTFSACAKRILGDGECPWAQIDAVMRDPAYQQRAFFAAVTLLRMYARDPHENVRMVASTVLAIVEERRASDLEDDAEVSFPSPGHNDALHRIAFRVLIEYRRRMPGQWAPALARDTDPGAATWESIESDAGVAAWSEGATEGWATGESETMGLWGTRDGEGISWSGRPEDEPSPSEGPREKEIPVIARSVQAGDEPIQFVEFARSGLAVASRTAVFAIVDGDAVSLDVGGSQVTGLVAMPDGLVLGALTSGCLMVWAPPRAMPVVTVRVVARPIQEVVLLLRRIGMWTVAVVQADMGIVGVWDIVAKQLGREIVIGREIVSFDAQGEEAVFGCSDGEIVKCNLTIGEIEEIHPEGDVVEVRSEGEAIWARNAAEEWRIWKGESWELVSDDSFYLGGGKFAEVHERVVRLVDSDGKVLGAFRSQGTVNAFALHPTQPFGVIGTENGWVHICEQTDYY
jgi:hypothetical protein